MTTADTALTELADHLSRVTLHPQERLDAVHQATAIRRHLDQLGLPATAETVLAIILGGTLQARASADHGLRMMAAKAAAFGLPAPDLDPTDAKLEAPLTNALAVVARDIATGRIDPATAGAPPAQLVTALRALVTAYDSPAPSPTWSEVDMAMTYTDPVVDHARRWLAGQPDEPVTAPVHRHPAIDALKTHLTALAHLEAKGAPAEPALAAQHADTLTEVIIAAGQVVNAATEPTDDQPLAQALATLLGATDSDAGLYAYTGDAHLIEILEAVIAAAGPWLAHHDGQEQSPHVITDATLHSLSLVDGEPDPAQGIYPITVDPEEDEKVTDIMAALEQSIADAKAARTARDTQGEEG